MQTVWSRVSQARYLCNCPTCLSATNAIARRTTTAAPRRKIRVGDVFTVFSSSLAAAATLADSNRKDARREHWNKAIDKARAQVEATEIRLQSRLASLCNAAEGETVIEDRAMDRNISGGRGIKEFKPRYGRPMGPQTRSDSWTNVFQWAAQQDEARVASGFEDWRGPPLTLLQGLSSEQLEKFSLDERLLRRFYGGPECAALVEETSKYCVSKKKLRTLEWSVLKLVIQMLLHSSKQCQATQNKLERPTDCAQHSTDGDAATGLSAEVKPGHQQTAGHMPEKCVSRRGSDNEGTVPDNDFLKALIQDEHEVRQRLAYIDSRLSALHRTEGTCENSEAFEIAESPQVPRYRGDFESNLKKAHALTYSFQKLLNLMIHANDPSPLISKICYNLLKSNGAPDIHTYNLLLVRFCSLGYSTLVQAVLTSMRESHIRPNEITHSTLLRYFTLTNNEHGFREYFLRMEGYHGGLALAHPQGIAPIAVHQYRFFGQHRRKAAEKARMNREVYESLIIGTLRFFGEQYAMQHYRNMISEGWKASVAMLTAILKHYCHRHEWEAGVSVWNHIIATSEGATTLAYEFMLLMCQACGQQSAFDQILHDGIDRGVLPAATSEILGHVHLQNSSSPRGDAVSAEPSETQGILPNVAPISGVDNGTKSVTVEGHLRGDALPIPSNEKALQANAVPLETQAVNAIHMTKSLEPEANILAIDIKDTALQVNTHQIAVKPTSSSHSSTMDNLSVRIKKINGEESQKMTDQEHKEYTYNIRSRHLRNRKRVPWNGQVTARISYERYKKEAKSNLEKKILKSRRIRLDAERSIVQNLADSSSALNPSSAEDDHCPLLVDDEKQLPIINKILWSSSLRELDQPTTLMSFQLQG